MSNPLADSQTPNPSLATPLNPLNRRQTRSLNRARDSLAPLKRFVIPAKEEGGRGGVEEEEKRARKERRRRKKETAFPPPRPVPSPPPRRLKSNPRVQWRDRHIVIVENRRGVGGGLEGEGETVTDNIVHSCQKAGKVGYERGGQGRASARATGD